MYKKSILTLLSLLVILSSMFIMSCNDDSSGPQTITNNALKLRPIYLPTILEDQDIILELWVMDSTDESTLVSIDQFFWDDEAYEFRNEYGFKRKDIFNLPKGKTTDDYNKMMISFEPYPDDSREMSQSNLLSGPIIPVYPILALEFDATYKEAAGSYVLTTLTDYDINRDDLNSNEPAGLWFLYRDPGEDFAYENFEVGLTLPVLADDYNMIYEAWVYKEGFTRPLSLGKFRNCGYRDLSNPYIDNKFAPVLPGEDFLYNEPSGFDFPLTLVADTRDDSTAVYITMEPYPDPLPRDPFPLILLSRNLPVISGAVPTPENQTHVNMQLGNRYTTLPYIEVTRTTATK